MAATGSMPAGFALAAPGSMPAGFALAAVLTCVDGLAGKFEEPTWLASTSYSNRKLFVQSLSFV